MEGVARRDGATPPSVKREARSPKITGGVVDGTFVARSALTIEQACRDWLAGMHDIEPTTRAAYTHALKPLRDRHGDMPVQQLTKSHLDQLITDLNTGAFPGQKRPWTANSINPMLNLISRVLADLVRQGALARDVAGLVERLKRPEAKLTTFSEEVRRVLKHVENDRLGHALAPRASRPAPRRDQWVAVVRRHAPGRP